MSEVYSLYLNSASGNPYITNLTTSLVYRSYSVNWDSFFAGANQRFKKCKIRYEFNSDPATGTTQMDPTTYNSVLAINGLGSKFATKYANITLGLLRLESIQVNGATPSVQTCLTGENLTGPGQNIEVPMGYKDLNIGLYQTAVNPMTLISTALIQNWDVILHFELYDEI